MAIAILACECVASPGRTGLGGGFVAMIYRQKTGLVETLIATEKAYLAELPNDKQIHKVGVPGMLDGLDEMYKRYGTTMGWDRLIDGAYDLAKKYAENNDELLKEYGEFKHLIKSAQLQETLEDIMYNEPKEFYNGEMGKKFINDINGLGGFMKISDLSEYE